MILRHETFAGTRVAVASRTNRGVGPWRPWISCPSPPGCPFARPRRPLRDTRREQAAHFQALRDKTSVAYRHMLFFDNEGINCEEVGQLGVCCVHCPGGMSQGAWEKGCPRRGRGRGR